MTGPGRTLRLFDTGNFTQLQWDPEFPAGRVLQTTGTYGA